MERATILDLADINELMSELEGFDCHEFVRSTLLSPMNYWFYKDGTAMSYQIMDNNRFNMHIYNRARGDKRLVEWCRATGIWMFENTDAKNLMNFVKMGRRDLRFFMVSIGSKKIGKIGDEILYNYSREDYIRGKV